MWAVEGCLWCPYVCVLGRVRCLVLKECYGMCKVAFLQQLQGAGALLPLLSVDVRQGTKAVVWQDCVVWCASASALEQALATCDPGATSCLLLLLMSSK